MGEGEGGPRTLRRYRVDLRPAADRALRKLQRSDRERIRDRVDALATNPRPPGTKALQAQEGFLRLRVGDYRVVYQVKDELLLVLVVNVGHRGKIYR